MIGVRSSFKSARPRPRRVAPGSARPTIQILEDRTLLSFLAPISQSFNGFDIGGMAAGDFLGNHIQDLAVVEPGNRRVLIFLGNGDGTFQAPSSIAVGVDAANVAAADLAHTGHDDLVVTHFNEGTPRNTVSVLLSNGDGSFRAPVEYPAGDNPHSVAIGDVNGDGVPDIVVANEGFFVNNQFVPGTTVNVLLGNGDGTFQPARTFDTGAAPEGVAVGDFTGDGRLSIVTADEASGDVAFLKGNGNGTFQPPVFLSISPSGEIARSVGVADLTGTGKLDLVAAIDDTSGPGVSVILGNGNGTFRNGVVYPASVGTGSIVLRAVLGDFNGDGSPDVAVESFLGTGGGLDVLVNNGDGTFQAPTEVTNADFGTGALAVGDFTGDGSADLAYGTPGVLSVYLRQPGGLFKMPTVLATGPGTTSVQTADLRNDHNADLIIANATTNTVGVLLGKGNGAFQAQVTHPVGRNPRQVIATDLLNHGLLDLVTVNLDDRTLSVLLANGDGTFQAATAIPLDAPTNYAPVRVVAGDFEHNGNVDLMVLEQNNSFQDSGLIMLHGHGDGTFTQDPIQHLVGAVNDPRNRITFQAIDLRHSGSLDLIISDSLSRSVSIYLGNGDGTFGPERVVLLGTDLNDGITSVAVTDLRGNGILDLVASSYDLFRPDNVLVALGNGDGTFQAPVRYGAAGAAMSVVAGDFNGDGIPDAAVAEWGLLGGQSNGISLSVLSGLGDGTFGPPTNYAVTGNPENMVTADVNGDGAPDLALDSALSGNVSVVLNANDGTAPGRDRGARTPLPSSARSQAAGLGTAFGQATTLPSAAVPAAVVPSPLLEPLPAMDWFVAGSSEDRQAFTTRPQRSNVHPMVSDETDVFPDGLTANPFEA